MALTPPPTPLPTPYSAPQQALNISSTDFWTYANTTIRAGYPNATEYAAAEGWVRNATCFCDTQLNDTDLFGNAVLLYLNQSVSYQDPAKPAAVTTAQIKGDPYYCPSE